MGGWSVVTGAASGIGFEIARQFAQPGPVLAIDWNEEALRQAFEGIRERQQGAIELAVADISPTRSYGQNCEI
jgi:NAD(P)-dependent dehydrogenase (short-subunit alcohol dehydrogenase family)